MTIVLASAVISVSTILIAYLMRRARREDDVPRRDSVIRNALRFIGGPFPLSIALHAFLLLFLIITLHESRARDLTLLTIETGGGGGGGDEMSDLDIQEEPMPEIERTAFPQPVASDSTAITTSADDYVRAVSGFGIGTTRGGGLGSGYGPGLGSGFGGYLLELRRKGLDVVLVIDGTGSMSLVIQDVKARMRELVAAIHRMVPTARIGMVVYGGKGEAIERQALTLSPSKLEGFLGSIGASGGDEREENVRGGIATAIDKMDWRPYAKKVIVLVADTPPSRDDFAATRELIAGFRAHNGTFNAVDLSQLEHERFERAFDQKVHQDQGASKPVGALPQFYRETQLAYQVLTRDGGGVMHSLDSNEQINQQMMILAFGDQWRDMIAAFNRPLARK
jgi:hypothetical protein